MTAAQIFRERLSVAIFQTGRTMTAIAEASGYSEDHIRLIIRGKRVNPTIAFIEAMAVTLDISLFWLLGGSDPKQVACII